MKMQEVLEFLLTIPKKDRPKNLANIISTISDQSRLVHTGYFVAGSNGKLYATCSNYYVEIASKSSAGDEDIYGEVDVEEIFEQFAKLLEGFTIKKFGAKMFNIWAQQLIELDEEKALPIVEKKLQEICGDFWVASYLCHNVNGSDNTTFHIFLAPLGNVIEYPQELEVNINTTIKPTFISQTQLHCQTVLTSVYRLQCAEFLLECLTEE